MQSNDPTQILSQEQIADAINRAKIGSQRQKNEMMRLGASDPTSFQMNFNTQLQDQSAPQEFWGAGRKLASNQSPDQETSDFAGAALPTLGGQRYYYGDTDYSIPENIQKSLLGSGFKTTGGEIDTSLSNLFTDIPTTQYHNQSYYKGDIDPSDSNSLITRAGWTKAGNNFDPNVANIIGDKVAKYKDQFYYQGQDPSLAQWGTQGYTQQDIGGGKYNILDQTGNNIGVGYKSLDDTIRELTSQYNKDHPVNINSLKEGELYFPDGQQYTPAIIPGGDLEKWEVLGQLLNNKPPPYNTNLTYGLPGNNIDEQIKGLNTLFGSTPLINNGKVAGYKFDPTPIDESIFGYTSPNSIERKDTRGHTRFNQSLAREYNDLDSWSKLVKNIDENSMYVPAENVEQLPGWTNKDINQYQHQRNGTLPTIFKAIGTALSFTPLAPVGLAMTTLANLQSGNHLSAAASVLGSAANLGGVGQSLGQATGLGTTVGNGIVRGGLGALGALNKGGSSALLSGLGSGLSGAAGDLVSSNLGGIFGQTGSNIIGGGVGGALQSVFNKENPLQGAIQGGLSSGLGSFLSSLNSNGENMDSKRKQTYNNAGKTLVNLIKPKIVKGR
jgi:hypothetical protein